MSKNILDLYLSKSHPVVTDEMLAGFSRLKKISISAEVIKLPIGAFHDQLELRKAYFEINSKLTKIPESCFAGCVSLKDFGNLPSNLISIDEKAFVNCTSIQELVIPDSVEFIAEDAFDGWCGSQTLCMKREFSLSSKCKAKIECNSDTNNALEELNSYENNGKATKYIVTVKCGHVGNSHYMKIDFPITACTKKDAVIIAKSKGRVKRDHKDVILGIRAVSDQEFFKQQEINQKDPYLTIKSKHEQSSIQSLINERKIEEPRYSKRKDKRKNRIYLSEKRNRAYLQKRTEKLSFSGENDLGLILNSDKT
jgi:hypothetical protein